jgi:long-chain acyl-CoA synthetase
VRAFVLLDEGAELTELDLIRECRTRLENFMVPREVVFVTELPHTESGKVRKKSLPRDPLASSPASKLSLR